MVIMDVISMDGRGRVFAIDIGVFAEVCENLGAGQPSDKGADEREEYDDLIHWLRFSPS